MRDDDYVRFMNSTIVRSKKSPRSAVLVRAAGAMLSALAPTLAARLGERMFLTPPRPRPSAHEATALATARARSLPIGRHRVDTWAWGSGPTVLLVHGWGGRGAQMAAFVAPLVGRGFS
ncbi:MAG TPA: hypothetical protein VGW35_26045, partial [Methylomirabilota bacterium]|nr:hypothetical protein [Methylomirabilota bacterium]